jgi:hypothetical protein
MALHIQFIFKLLTSIKHVRHDSSLAQSLPTHNIFIIDQWVGFAGVLTGWCGVSDRDSNITQGLRAIHTNLRTNLETATQGTTISPETKLGYFVGSIS